jgi:hypothetical protein
MWDGADTRMENAGFEEPWVRLHSQCALSSIWGQKRSGMGRKAAEFTRTRLQQIRDVEEEIGCLICRIDQRRTDGYKQQPQVAE